MTRRIVKFISLASLMLASTACTVVPQGPERVALVEDLVARQEFAKAEELLEDIDARDPAFEELVVRRRAIRPLIVQFEQRRVEQIAELQAQDDWTGAEAVLEDALRKLPDSESLRQAEQEFYADRLQRLEQIDRQISLLRGQHLTSKTPLVEQAREVHPDGLSVRWRAFRHGREAEALAAELRACGEHALAESRYELAESCLKMALNLTEDEVLHTELAQLEERRAAEEAAAIARAEAERKAEEAARLARKTEQVEELKARYQRLYDAQWWTAAREVLAELQLRAEDDPQVVGWSEELQEIISAEVEERIQEGQGLYSQGELHRALAVWQEAAGLDPDNAVLQAHIARVQRFIAKLERLDQDDV